MAKGERKTPEQKLAAAEALAKRAQADMDRDRAKDGYAVRAAAEKLEPGERKLVHDALVKAVTDRGHIERINKLFG